MFNSKLMVN